ncbi:hypothetical protein H0H81_007631 [Sphagnurus paluster]|uniref:Nucleoside diphosphate kinase n=1 Tax=Sphagnurus paluster TaxID=117069 RepID=A0A9P7K4X1_9AGAR|nr:hypothetical protein H0H81_007631 [Sphagnurus paluster]
MSSPHDTASPTLLSSPSPPAPITRTVAIIKPHALVHRFDIEPRIQEAGFEIVKERQMEFDTETDPDTLFELFGEDAASFSEGPVWVYVLERRRAAQVWLTLMGHPDPATARLTAPTSLRALYGVSHAQNAVMGSADADIAEVQITSIFASSPPFPTTDLPDVGVDTEEERSVRTALLQSQSDEGYAASNPSSGGGGSAAKSITKRNPTFRARPVPATNATPDIVPRTTRAAALRAGQVVEPKRVGPRRPLSKEQLAKTFENIPGHRRRESIPVASTAAPAIVPRMTRAASLRLGIKQDPPRRRTLSTEEVAKAKTAFDGIPGHKRRESIAVASIKAPSIAPRLNRTVALRQQKEKEQGPPSSFMFRGATAQKLPGLSRSNSHSSLKVSSTPAAAPAPAPATRPTRQAPRPSAVPPVRSTAVKRSSSVSGTTRLPPKATSTATSDSSPEDGNAKAPPPARRVPRPSSVAANPTIPPRTNRSAALRAAKLEAEQAAAATAARKSAAARKKVPPSSFKAVAA